MVLRSIGPLVSWRLGDGFRGISRIPGCDVRSRMGLSMFRVLVLLFKI